MSNKAKTFGIVGGVAVVLLGASYGGGYMMGRAEVEAVEQTMHAADEAATAEKDRLEGELADRDARVDALEQSVGRLEARRLLDIALRDLDARNFGLAQSHLAEVGAKLTEAAGDDAELRALATELSATSVTVSEDFEPQRQTLLGFLTGLDAELD